MKYRIIVSVKTVETWEVDVRDQAEARELWEEGILLSTSNYEVDKILSVKELAYA